jgi:hypothetical protein
MMCQDLGEIDSMKAEPMKARFSQELLASAFPGAFGYQKRVRDLGTETLTRNLQLGNGGSTARLC